ncbi:MAG: SDR family NAD(P)-dependent oxidoreductase [Alphaproteobacteria bacterium]|nr:SDR family NAD(P)-dependent oxidoreductase [Alphaproteobacteria bacterium]
MTSLCGKSVLVTGGDGFIGSHLVERLAVVGAKVTALAQYNSFDTAGWLDECPAAQSGEVEVVRGDVRDADMMKRVVAGKNIVFHLAALIGIPYSYVAASSYVAVNIAGTLNVLEAAREAGVSRVIHTSTSEVYGTAQYEPIDESHPLSGQSPYSASKIGADMLAESFYRSFELPVYLIRPFNTFGPRQSERAVIPSVIRQALDESCDSIRIGSAAPRRDFCFVGDTVAAFCALAESDRASPGIPYNVGTGTAVTIGQMVEQVRASIGCTKPVVQESQRTRPNKSEVMALVADSGALRAVSDWVPAFDLQAGLDLTAEWWRERMSSGRVRRDAGYSI